MHSLTLHMPLPPSVNGLFAGTKRRYKSEKYEAWILSARGVIYEQSYRLINYPVSVSYLFGKPDKRKRDLDNLFKAPNDLLVAMRILDDDSLIHRISGEWADIDGCIVTLERYAVR